jgi:hypothetical protein
MLPYLAPEIVERILRSLPIWTRLERRDVHNCVAVCKTFAMVGRTILYHCEELPAAPDMLRRKLDKWEEHGKDARGYVRELEIEGTDQWILDIVTHDALHRIFNIFQHVRALTIRCCVWYGSATYHSLPQHCALLRSLTVERIRFESSTTDLAYLASQCESLVELKVWDCTWIADTTSWEHAAVRRSHLRSVYIVPLRIQDAWLLGRLVKGAQSTLQEVHVTMRRGQTFISEYVPVRA